MSDVVDVADKLIEERIKNGLKAIQPFSTVDSKVEDCLHCGEPIGEKRKQAVPSATHCITCATRIEKGH